MGQSRAGTLATYLTEYDLNNTNVSLFDFGLPAVIFATRAVLVSDDTVRCIQTVIPTALKLQLPVHSPFATLQEHQLAQFILNDPRYNGKNVLICWHHTRIATLINELGYLASSSIYPYPNRYDWVWQLTFPAPVPAQVVNPIYQQLLYDDETTPP